MIPIGLAREGPVLSPCCALSCAGLLVVCAPRAMAGDARSRVRLHLAAMRDCETFLPLPPAAVIAVDEALVWCGRRTNALAEEIDRLSRQRQLTVSARLVAPSLPDDAETGAGWLRARRDASAHRARLRAVLTQMVSLLGEVRCIPGRLQDEVQVNLLVPAAETHPVLHELQERLRIGDALWSACTVTGPWPPYAFISWETA
ncbi:hypothetical protein U5903_19820 [Cereibacter johrii]|uniref:hypothetical protein n=1 Tax=Cereibacter johrii TaxID=445629 RepID=UPI002B257AEB|nr:hypothetical protein [Cereibacter johrii]MEA5163038.1 hypothetical protein [Cereibacter johrii]